MSFRWNFGLRRSTLTKLTSNFKGEWNAYESSLQRDSDREKLKNDKYLLQKISNILQTNFPDGDYTRTLPALRILRGLCGGM